jgi:hypothetical protein
VDGHAPRRPRGALSSRTRAPCPFRDRPTRASTQVGHDRLAQPRFAGRSAKMFLVVALKLRSFPTVERPNTPAGVIRRIRSARGRRTHAPPLMPAGGASEGWGVRGRSLVARWAVALLTRVRAAVGGRVRAARRHWLGRFGGPVTRRSPHVVNRLLAAPCEIAVGGGRLSQQLICLPL